MIDGSKINLGSVTSIIRVKGLLEVGVENDNNQNGQKGGEIRLAGVYGDNGSSLCRIYTQIYDSSNECSELVLYKGNDQNSSGPDRIRFCASEIVFDILNTDRDPISNTNVKMMITNNGNMGIGTIPSYRLDVSGNIRSTGFLYGGGQIQSNENSSMMATTYWVTTNLYNASTTIATNLYNASTAISNRIGTIETTYAKKDDNAIITFGTSSNTAHILTCNGGVNATSFNATSDERVKTNIVDLDRETSLSIVRQLKPKKYDFKESVVDQLGFIAQEIKKIDLLSPAVNDNSKGMIPIGRTVNCHEGMFSLDLSLNVMDRIQYRQDDQINTATIVYIEEGHTQLSHLLNGDVYLLGIEIHDLHSIQKDMIYTLAVSALQRLDEIVTNQQQTIDRQQHTIDRQQKQLELHEKTLEYLLRLTRTIPYN